MTEINDKNTFHFEDLNADSLFKTPLIQVIGEVSSIQSKIDRCFSQYDKVIDDRALAIIGMLLIENEIDDFLSISIKGYSKIKDDQAMTFSFKCDLASSLKIMPSKIINAIEPIRQIRNLFAHNLEINSFIDAKKFVIEKKKKNPFPLLYNKIKTIIYGWDDNDDKKTYKQLLIAIILGIHVYSKHIDQIQSFIWNKNNFEKIIKKTI